MMSAQLQGSAAFRNTVSAATAERGPAPVASRSPYVESQKDSPIRWETFGQQAIDRARAENKLIFLHIGYSASHYCYLTIQESFSNPHVIELLNNHFVPIIVDREERPDLDTIYMNYVQSLNSTAAGHPLNVLLTPALEPVFGGTYFPSPGSHQIVPETGDEIADFLVVLQKAQTSWAEQEGQIRADGKQSVEMLRKMIDEGTLGLGDTMTGSAAGPSGQRPSDVDIDQLEEAYSHISKTFDKSHGGFLHMPAYVPPNFLSGQIPPDQMGEVYELIKMTPKFILPAKISFLLRATQFPQTVVDIVGDKLSSDCTQFAIQTLRQVVAGAVHDHVGAGFHRCSTTWDWSLPSFEKMMSDNALALGIYLDAWLLNGASKDDEFAGVVLELADYLTGSPIRLEHGGFASSEAADSCNRRGDKVLRHGAYYLWTRKEFDTVIGDEQQSRVAAAYWNVKEHGNVDNAQDPNDEYLNQNILRVVKTPAELSAQFKLPEASIRQLIESAKAKLKARREKDRPRPALDAKLVTAYNGMAIAALARTYWACEYAGKTDKAAGYLSAARDAALFIKKQLWDAETKTLYRLFYNGARSGTKAFAEDYAFLIEGLLELYEATGDNSWLEWAIDLQETQIKKFYDPMNDPTPGSNARCGAFYRTSQDEPHILLRIKDAMDTSQPSDNAVSASNLFRLGALLDDARYTRLATETVNAFEAEILQYPYLFPGLLTSVAAWKLNVKRWVSVGNFKEGLKTYYLSPRGHLWTLLHEPSIKFLKNDKLAEKLKALPAKVYAIGEDEQISAAVPSA